jgi:hypothetical protein
LCSGLRGTRGTRPRASRDGLTSSGSHQSYRFGVLLRLVRYLNLHAVSERAPDGWTANMLSLAGEPAQASARNPACPTSCSFVRQSAQQHGFHATAKIACRIRNLAPGLDSTTGFAEFVLSQAEVPSRVGRQWHDQIRQANAAHLVAVLVDCRDEVQVGLSDLRRWFRRDAGMQLDTKIANCTESTTSPL